MEVNKICEDNISLGDLVFILHKEKPVKNGWWRKVRCGKLNNRNIIYILEKPIHKDFSLSHKDVRDSRIEHGMCIMKQNSLSYGINVIKKFDILINAKGVAQSFVSQNNYLMDSNKEMINSILTEFDNDFLITSEGKILLESWTNKISKNEIFQFESNDIRFDKIRPKNGDCLSIF